MYTILKNYFDLVSLIKKNYFKMMIYESFYYYDYFECEDDLDLIL